MDARNDSTLRYGDRVTEDDARRIALALPGTVEAGHHGRPSFRVKGRIFATLMTPGKCNVMPGLEPIMDAVDAHPETCSELWWGSRLAAVQVDLAAADAHLLGDLLGAAHAFKSAGPAARARPSG